MAQIKVDINKCTGCGLCELACSAEKERVYNPEKSRIRVVREGIIPTQVKVLVCAQCENPACMLTCPNEAIKRDEGTGALVVDESLCSGCGLCVDACPLDAIKLHMNTRFAVKCDLCNGAPKCIERCVRGALVYE